ncbi:hypothetical protein QPM17_04240 [Marinobacter sp. TBZ242]|uniref:Uncharacterized protein n=1 Tax=Marinobacter azerbaijanicus TaxID=3050455 RepID=A0ABT7I9D8_9GAMM|nr:hypothetical protein [Marinobacter sp. TBZ242]MDL0430320.1 hypothetical protein [Marinobacter sp. TBZ242]
MLKELWRKLGSELSPSAWPEAQDSQQSRRGTKDGRGQFRILPHMTHTGEFHLERLTGILKGRYGKTFSNNGDESIRDLIHFASRIQDQDVQRELLLFYLNCSPIVQEYLRSEEVLAENHFLSRTF